MLTLTSISKTYPTAAGPLRVLDDVTLTLVTGEAAAITGPSGSGKSTLLYVIGGLEAPTRGSVDLDGTNPYALRAEPLARFRNREIGFVFQDHCLLPQLTVLENVLVPTLVGDPDPDARDRAHVLLGAVGLEPRVHHRPAQLSGGEKQRVAIARALVMQPALVLCDEPTGNLDARAADAVGTLLTDLHRRLRSVLVVVTHSAELARRFADRRLLRAGRLVAA